MLLTKSYAHEVPEPLTPTPAGGTISQTVRLHGIICLDINKDLTCDPDASGVNNVIIRSSDGFVAASDKTGNFSIPVISETQITLLAPGGYVFPDGSSQATRVITSTQTKFAVWEEPTPQPKPISTAHVVVPQSSFECCADDFGLSQTLVRYGIYFTVLITFAVMFRYFWRRRKA